MTFFKLKNGLFLCLIISTVHLTITHVRVWHLQTCACVRVTRGHTRQQKFGLYEIQIS